MCNFRERLRTAAVLLAVQRGGALTVVDRGRVPQAGPGSPAVARLHGAATATRKAKGAFEEVPRLKDSFGALPLILILIHIFQPPSVRISVVVEVVPLFPFAFGQQHYSNFQLIVCELQSSLSRSAHSPCTRDRLKLWKLRLTGVRLAACPVLGKAKFRGP